MLGPRPGRRPVLWVVAVAGLAVVVVAAIVAGTGLLGGPAAKPSPSPSLGPYRTNVKGFDTLYALAADGRGVVWITGSTSDRLLRYRPVGVVASVPIQPAGDRPTRSTAPSMTSAPDGSVWWMEPEDGTARRVTPDGQITSLRLGEPKSLNDGRHPPTLAVTRDGSVWFGADGSLARIFPDGRRQTYEVPVTGVLAADSKGDVWSPSDYLYRVTASGTVTRFTFSRTVVAVAEGRDGAMWLLDSGVDPTPRLGYLDASGAVTYFPFRNFPSYYPLMVRAADGAVWFWTRDGRLVRALSKTDVTVYSLPWSDADLRVGVYHQEPLFAPFAVLAGNRVVMVARVQVLDFPASGGTRLPGAGALPTPTPYQAQSAAETAAYAAVRERAGQDVNVNLFYKMETPGAAAYLYTITEAGGGQGGGEMAAYLYLAQGTWQLYELGSTTWPPWAFSATMLHFRDGGCLNARESPSFSARVNACLGTGTEVGVDDGPVYADGTLWWHVAGRGWAVHQYLRCTESAYQLYQQC